MSTEQMRAPRPAFKAERSGARKPFKPKPWSHQRELEAAKGKRIALTMTDATLFVGQLLEADQFTIKFQDEKRQSALTVSKHSIALYAIL